MPVHSSHGILALSVFLAVSNYANKNNIEKSVDSGPQQVEARKNNNALSICLPHMNRLTIK